MVDTQAMMAAETTHELGTYPKRPVAIVRGEGAHLWDSEGRQFIDCVGGQGAANLGHSHPRIVGAVQQQVAQLMSCPEIFHNDQRAAYLQELAAVLPIPARLFLCNSGAEAIEASIKVARLVTKRRGILAAMRGFHGRTFGALSATWDPKYREPFQPLVPQIDHVAYNNVAALDTAINDQTAALILETVQGEGGVRPAQTEYLYEAQRLCNERGALLIIDEVQTGFGRTGRMFGVEHYDGLIPDMMVLAKSIAGGLPMGALALHSRHGGLPPGSHGTTFGGNPVVCAAARAVLQVLQEEHIVEHAAQEGAWLLERLRALRSGRIREVRGQGLLVGIELKERVVPFLLALIDHGVLALPAGTNVLRLLPPLVMGRDDLETVAERLEQVLA